MKTSLFFHWLYHWHRSRPQLWIFFLKWQMLYKIGAFENNPTPNQSRFSICGILRLHCLVRVFSEDFLACKFAYFCPERQRSEIMSTTLKCISLVCPFLMVHWCTNSEWSLADSGGRIGILGPLRCSAYYFFNILLFFTIQIQTFSHLTSLGISFLNLKQIVLVVRNEEKRVSRMQENAFLSITIPKASRAQVAFFACMTLLRYVGNFHQILDPRLMIF